LKIEVNCREHFTIYGIQESTLAVDSEWFRGQVLLPSYDIAELLGTKMRALYQRRKGRDLFDLHYAMTQTNAEPSKIIAAWKYYMEEEGNAVSQLEFIDNMEKKMTDKDFLGDMRGLLRPNIVYEPENAYQFIKTELLEKI
jgi:predicted nucleotidyltransferase component of viral defense system